MNAFSSRRLGWLGLALLLAVVPPPGAVSGGQREAGEDDAKGGAGVAESAGDGAPDPAAGRGLIGGDGSVRAGRRDAKDPAVLTRWYDVRDLLIDVPDFTDAPVFEPRDWTGHGLALGGANVCFPDPYPYDDSEDEGRTREELVEELSMLIRETVDPDSWRDNGGPDGAIREHGGQLIITQTAANHAKVAEFLVQERARQPQTVRVRARWVLTGHAELAKLLKPAGGGEGGAVRSPARTVDAAALDALAEKAVHYRAETLCLDHQRVFVLSTRHGPPWSIERTPAAAVESPTTRPTRLYPSAPDRTFDAGAVLDFAVTTHAESGTAVLTLRSQIVEADPPFGPAGIAGETRDAGGDMKRPAGPRRLNELRTSARVPLGRMVLVGGMTADPTTRVPDGAQLYLFVEVTTE